ncbi:MAG: AAA family ATPase [Dolichospermum sp. LBC05a]|nr:ATP-binding protein [Dolichospermum sp. OL01]MCO5798048.1 ATP-binding protein [Dolichospermum sp. OL03]QSV59524.1 MAG: AAA family ATPase [Dolichospermum sp. LBC05a]
MTCEYSFPLELLNASASEKLNYFKTKVIVPHRNLREISNELLKNILDPDDALVYLVFGVTGVGKTTLRKRLQKVLMEILLDDLISNPGKIAVAGIEVPAPEGGKFSHLGYYEMVLEALNEVLIQYKVDYDISDNKDESFEPKSSKLRNARTLRRAIEKVFRYRELEAFMVDEGQHIFATSGARQMLEQMNWIKSIANLTETVHVLFGTYELLNCPILTGQVGRRSEDFHFTPYDKEDKLDYAEFKKVALTFAQHLPLVKLPDFENRIDYLIDYSIGNIGIFHGWLYRSLRESIHSDCTALTDKHLKLGELAPYKRRKISVELDNGKRVFAQLNSEEKTSPTPLPKITAAGKAGDLHRRSVGQRNPERDPVGID